MKKLTIFFSIFSTIILFIPENSYAIISTDIDNRSLPKIINVTSNLDLDRKGTFRWAINEANISQKPVIINLISITEAIKLNQTLPTINTDLIIKGNQKTIIDGQNDNRIFKIKKGNVLISDLQIINGLVQGNNGHKGSGAEAGIGGGLFMEGGNVKLKNVIFTNNKAVGGEGDNVAENAPNNSVNNINQIGGKFYVNRGAITKVSGIGIGENDLKKINLDNLNINSDGGEYFANRGAIAGVNGVGVNGIGVIAFGGGGGFGGFGNAGNGGNGGNGGIDGGNGGNGGHGGDGGVGLFGTFGMIDGKGAIGNISFGGGGGFGGFGNAGNGGNGGNICTLISPSDSGNSYAEDEETETDLLFDNTLDNVLEKSATPKIIDNSKVNQSDKTKKPEVELQPQESTDELVFCGNGGDGGNGGNGGFGGGGGSGGFGGNGGVVGKNGIPGRGGFGAGNGGLGFGGSGAGLGGAIFVKSGTLSLENTNFIGNMALGGKGISPGLGKGGAIFVLNNSLLLQSKMNQSPKVIFLDKAPLFEGNIATDAQNLPTDNNNTFGDTFVTQN